MDHIDCDSISNGVNKIYSRKCRMLSNIVFVLISLCMLVFYGLKYIAWLHFQLSNDH